jgi:hypothetical protein
MMAMRRVMIGRLLKFSRLSSVAQGGIVSDLPASGNAQPWHELAGVVELFEVSFSKWLTP